MVSWYQHLPGRMHWQTNAADAHSQKITPSPTLLDGKSIIVVLPILVFIGRFSMSTWVTWSPPLVLLLHVFPRGLTEGFSWLYVLPITNKTLKGKQSTNPNQWSSFMHHQTPDEKTLLPLRQCQYKVLRLSDTTQNIGLIYIVLLWTLNSYWCRCYWCRCWQTEWNALTQWMRCNSLAEQWIPCKCHEALNKL